MQKVVGVALICLFIPYLYWYGSIDIKKPLPLISNFMGENGWKLLTPNNSSDDSDYEDNYEDLTNSREEEEKEEEEDEDDDFDSFAERVITSGEVVNVGGGGEVKLINTNIDLDDPGRMTPHVQNKVINGGVQNASKDSEENQLHDRKLPMKKILVWNKQLRTASLKNFGLGIGRGAFLRLGCEYTACTVTDNRGQYSYKELDAILWHGRSRDTSFPPKRSAHTRYIFMMGEPPGHIRRLRPYTNVFNWTLTYRRDSEIPMLIGQFRKRQHPKADRSHINHAAGKTKMAAWFVSNCGTDSGRSKVTSQLKKYFPVDVYGKCGSLKCPRFSSIDCYAKAQKQYKFYLSFENSICRDYVTEKFFKALQYDLVPVVYGGADYTSIAPPKSYINVRDFRSIKALAEYLLYLNSNDTAYNEYFKWKPYYDVLAIGSSKSLAWCDLCKKLHTDNTTHVYRSMREWYIKQARCKTKNTKEIKDILKE